ncbi:sodium:phosphate symporter [Paenibacillus yonginensis]|uniref:Sodium:phosphate symporter n=1 Tax=Paenibacillus yonginensis TaxID=1462996 RepID=A0A1B1N182_9BACL|nr:Na/Pi symporter [Paenibacillus yonginensis]ANS75169.1 sodium:phosphate symporter [Paenibacillus yonginensis]
MFREMIIPLIFGLALFIFGMKMMELALQAWAGPVLTKLLNTVSATPLKGMVFSTAVTALLQSSTAVTVMTIGLVNAGLLTYGRTLGIILGGNIGTCLTTELIALHISSFGLPLLLLSLCIWFAAVVLHEKLPFRLQKHASLMISTQHAALAAAGFSIVLTAIAWMQSTGEALQTYGLIDWFTKRAESSILWGVAAGAVLAAVVHSSAAVIGLAMGLAAAGALPVPLGIAVVLGSNVGTCVTAVIASIGGTRSGRFVAWSHIVLNVGGCLLFLPFIRELGAASAWMTSDASAMIAHSQTLFNLLSSLIALPLCYLPVWKRLDKLA